MFQEFLSMCRRHVGVTNSTPFQRIPFRYIRSASAASESGNQYYTEAKSKSLEIPMIALDQTQFPRHDQEYRENPIGIQMLSKTLYNSIFPYPKFYGNSNLDAVTLARKHLEAHSLLGKTLDPLKDIELQLPSLISLPGKKPCIEEHFRILGEEQQHPYQQQAIAFASSKIPYMPKKWTAQAGWTKYTINGTEKVDFPNPDEPLVFDTEVFYKLSSYPAFAVAVSPSAWYVWFSKGFLEEMPSEELVPLGHPNTKRIVVGHHIAYDRARILEEYHIIPSEVAFIDTMSLHCSISGLSSQQKNAWTKSRKDLQKIALDGQDMSSDLNSQEEDAEPLLHHDFELESSNDEMIVDRADDEESTLKFNDWRDVSSPNSLASAAELHLNIKMDKSARDLFANPNLSGTAAPESLQELVTYCARDVQVTHSLFSSLLPKFLLKCPHPVSFAGMLQMGKSFLPVTEDWDEYISNAEKVCQDYQEQIEKRLMKAAQDALNQYETGEYANDEWLKSLDWTIKPIRMTKEKRNKKGDLVSPSRPYKNINMAIAGKPQWYCDLWDSIEKRIRLTPSKRVVPYILKIRWNGYPVYHCRQYGWTYRVPKKISTSSASITPLLFSQNPEDEFFDTVASYDLDHHYYRIPHPAGEGKNCGNPLSKGYIQAFDQGNLTADYHEAREILQLSASCSYWVSARDRVKSQFIVWDDPAGVCTGLSPPYPYTRVGIILPQSIPMGTVTRRAVEPTWMTASNAKATRVGSELKSKIMAPKGFKFVGADVDSQELWIASLLGDSQFGIHGSTAIGFMTLQGTKSAGTDLHSVTGSILGISRDQAKVFNYSRIYGAGLKHAVQLLLQSQPGLGKEEALQKAQQLYHRTKGKQMKIWDPEHGQISSYWSGGSESFMFNQLEHIANSNNPRTPVLDCQIPDSLIPYNVDKQFLTSRVNWVVQSSGVDYLHLLLVSMNYLLRRMNIHGRLLISIHDEVRFIVPEEDTLKAALSLQISNLWVRALFASRTGMEDLPLNVAFFSSVDIDHCLRKEVDMSCLTPSQSKAMTPGISLDIYGILDKLKKMKLDFTQLYGPELLSITHTINYISDNDGLRPGKSPVLPQTVSIVRIKQQLSQLCSEEREKSTRNKRALVQPQRLPSATKANSNASSARFHPA